MAELDGNPVGTCGLVKMDHPEYNYEITKMGVSPKAQGLPAGHSSLVQSAGGRSHNSLPRNQ